MEASTTICSLFGNEFDKEDIGYLQKSFCSLFSEATNKFSLNYNYEPESVLKSSLELVSQQPWASDEISVSNENCDLPYNCQNNNIFKPPNSKSIDNPLFDSKTMYSDILKCGVDSEDVDFIKRSFQNVLWDVNERYWTSKVFWVDHPPTADTACDINENGEYLSQNKTGSARTEGYVKIDKLSVLKRRTLLKKTDTLMSSDLSEAPYSKNYRGNKQSMSRDARNDQRRLSTAYQTITHSDLLKLNELKFRKKKLRLGKSEIHNLGIFACEPIAPNEIIIEYVGQIIRHIIADMRENAYKTSGIGSYCFRVDDETIIDATKYGNLNRYINHSCNPNSYAKILVINNQKKIVIYSKKSISAGEEITYDYKMPYEDDKILCLCNTPNCRKSLN